MIAVWKGREWWLLGGAREREEVRGERWVVDGGWWMVVVSESDESESKFSVREFSVKHWHLRSLRELEESCSLHLSLFHQPQVHRTLLVLTGLCTLPAPDFLQELIKGVLSEKAIAQNANGCQMTMLILDVLVLGWLESPCAEYQHHARPSKTWILESSSSEVSHVDGLKTFENISHAGNHSLTRRCGLVRWETGPGGVVMAIELRLASAFALPSLSERAV